MSKREEANERNCQHPNIVLCSTEKEKAVGYKERDTYILKNATTSQQKRLSTGQS